MSLAAQCAYAVPFLARFLLPQTSRKDSAAVLSDLSATNVHEPFVITAFTDIPD